MSSLAIPGQVLASVSSHIAGPGTHVHENDILASILGSIVTVPASNKSSKPIISIPYQQTTSATSKSSARSKKLPTVNSIVLCRVTRVQQRQLMASILVNDPYPSLTIVPYASVTNDDLQFQAVLRREDIRAYEKDKIVINEMYRVGDIIRATIISLGDEKTYYISTAGNELGVVVATSETGNAMLPASWKEMRDVVTGKSETRKVAKPT